MGEGPTSSPGGRQRSAEGADHAPSFDALYVEIQQLSKKKPEEVGAQLTDVFRRLSRVVSEAKREGEQWTQAFREKMSGVIDETFHYFADPSIFPDHVLFSEKVTQWIEKIDRNTRGSRALSALIGLYDEEAREAGILPDPSVGRTTKDVHVIYREFVRLLNDEEVHAFSYTEFMRRTFSASPRDRALCFMQLVLRRQTSLNGTVYAEETLGEHLQYLCKKGESFFDIAVARTKADPHTSPKAFLAALGQGGMDPDADMEEGAPDPFVVALYELCPLTRGGDRFLQFCSDFSTVAIASVDTGLIIQKTEENSGYRQALQKLYEELTGGDALSFIRSYGKDPLGPLSIPHNLKDSETGEVLPTARLSFEDDRGSDIEKVVRRLNIKDALALYEAWIATGRGTESTEKTVLQFYKVLSDVVSQYDEDLGRLLTERFLQSFGRQFSDADADKKLHMAQTIRIINNPDLARTIMENAQEFSRKTYDEKVTGEWEGPSAWDFFRDFLELFGVERALAYFRLYRDRRRVQRLHEAGVAWDRLSGRGQGPFREFAHAVRDAIAQGGDALHKEPFAKHLEQNDQVGQDIRTLQRAARMAGGPQSINDLVTTMFDNPDYRKDYIDSIWNEWSQEGWHKKLLFPRREHPWFFLRRWRGAGSRLARGANMTGAHLSILKAKQRGAVHVDTRTLKEVMRKHHFVYYSRLRRRMCWPNLEKEMQSWEERKGAFDKRAGRTDLLRASVERVVLECERVQLQRNAARVGLRWTPGSPPLLNFTKKFLQLHQSRTENPTHRHALHVEHIQAVRRYMQILQEWKLPLLRRKQDSDVEEDGELKREWDDLRKAYAKLAEHVGIEEGGDTPRVGGKIDGDWFGDAPPKLIITDTEVADTLRDGPPRQPDVLLSTEDALRLQRRLREVDAIDTNNESERGKLRRIMADLAITVSNPAVSLKTLKEEVKTEIETQLRVQRR